MLHHLQKNTVPTMALPHNRKHFAFYLLFVCLFIFLSACNKKNTEESLYLTDAESIKKGETLFNTNCASCHNFEQSLIGPNLSGVTADVSHEWLSKFIVNAPEMIQNGDVRSVALYDKYKQYMPPFPNLQDNEVDAILAYLNTFKESKQTPKTTADNALENPIPEPIQPSGITIVLAPFLQAPLTADEGIKARINRMGTITQNGKERMFINELRGFLYEIIDGEFKVFMDMKELMPKMVVKPGWGSGLAHFEFHPEFNENGLFYTSHTEKPGLVEADFTYADSIKKYMQYVITEWKVDDPTATVFSGTHREMLRANMVSQIHGVQDINFNPTAKKGDRDYGLLYIGVGDGGAAFDRFPELVHSKDRIWGSILRIDPLGNNSKNGQYGIPSINPWVNDPEALGEVICFGFRNPHHFTWTPDGEKMYVTDIGQHQIEEINIVTEGGDYGWPEREGTFRISTAGEADEIFTLTKEEANTFINPVAQYDHDEGNAIIGGIVYQDESLPALKDKFIFGDIVNGRVFFTNISEMEIGKQATIQSIDLKLKGANTTTTFQKESGAQRVALRIGTDTEKNLYFFTKCDGKVYKAISTEENTMASTN